MLKSLRNKAKGTVPGSEEKSSAEQAFRTYKAKELKGDNCTNIQPKSKDTMICIQFDNVEGSEFTHWSCVLG